MMFDSALSREEGLADEVSFTNFVSELSTVDMKK
jgi:hypothetical protein